MILNVEGEHGDGIRYEGSGRQQAIACPMTMQERPLVANRAPVPSHTRNERRHNASGEVSLRSSRFSQAHA